MPLKGKSVDEIVELVHKHLDLLEADLESAGLLELGKFVEVKATIESRRRGMYQSSTTHVDLIEVDGRFPPLELNNEDWVLINTAVSIMQELPGDVKRCVSVLESIEKKEVIDKYPEYIFSMINRYFRRLSMPFLIEKTEIPEKYIIRKFQLG